MLRIILQSIWYLLPGLLGNAMPIILARFSWFPFMAHPISGRFFGANKTWRGLLSGIITGIIVVLLQWYLEPYFLWLSLFPYRSMGIADSLLLGLLLSFGTLLMDMTKSLVKRKLGKPPGTSVPLLDQLDPWGGIFLGFLVFIPPLPHLIAMLLISPILMELANLISYFCRLKKVWW